VRVSAPAAPRAVSERVVDSFDIEQREEVLGRVGLLECEVPKTPVKAAIDGGREVPGARLVTDKHTVCL